MIFFGKIRVNPSNIIIWVYAKVCNYSATISEQYFIFLLVFNVVIVTDYCVQNLSKTKVGPKVFSACLI